MTPEDQKKFFELLQQFMSQSGGNLPEGLSGLNSAKSQRFPLGCKPDTLDNNSPRMYVRMSPATEHHFNEAIEWLRNTGFLSLGRKPKGQVLFHALVHEFCKLSDEDRLKLVRPYLD